MRNKKYLIILVIVLVLVIIPKNVNAETILKLGEEEINTVDNTNDDGTAIYNEEDNTLILDNYVGGPIIYYGTEALTIILNNTNEISSDYFSDGISLENAGLVLSGTGKLSIHEISNGIYIEDGDLTIDGVSIEISNIFGNAVMIGNDSVIINGSLTSNDDIEKKETEIGFAPTYQVINIQGGNIVINGDLTVTNARKALITDNDVIINSVNINITTFDNSIDAGNKFELNGGNVEIEIVPEPEPISEPEPTIESEPKVESEEEPVNPNTHDNVILYAMISLVSLLACIISIKYLKSSK